VLENSAVAARVVVEVAREFPTWALDHIWSTIARCVDSESPAFLICLQENMFGDIQ